MRLPFSALWSEFKTFAFKGNMIELAVAVVIGAAFSTVINSLVKDVIMPTVGYMVTTATTAAEKAKNVATDTVAVAASKAGLASTNPTTEPSTQPGGSADKKTPVAAGGAGGAAGEAGGGGKTDAKAPPAEPVKIDLMIGPVNIGAFLGSLLNFLLVAAAVFIVIVKLLGSVMKKMSKPPAPSEPTTRECPECLSLIPIKAKRCAHCTAVIAPA